MNIQSGLLTSCMLFYLNHIIYYTCFPLHLIVLHNLQCICSAIMWITRNKKIIWCDRIIALIYISLLFKYFYIDKMVQFEILRYYLSNTILFKLIDYKMGQHFKYKQTSIWYIFWHYNIIINNIVVVLSLSNNDGNDDYMITPYHFITQHVYCIIFELCFYSTMYYDLLCKLTFIAFVCTNPYIFLSIL